MMLMEEKLLNKNYTRHFPNNTFEKYSRRIPEKAFSDWKHVAIMENRGNVFVCIDEAGLNIHEHFPHYLCE